MRLTTGGKIGRPESDSITLAMEKIFAFIENHDDCQFSLQELKDVCEEPYIDNRTIKSKLKYGNRIIITEKLEVRHSFASLTISTTFSTKLGMRIQNKMKRKRDLEYLKQLQRSYERTFNR